MAREAVPALWEEHLRGTFPRGSAGEEVDGVDLVLLDSLAAGCVSSYLAAGGRLDPEHRAVLETCATDLSRVVPKLRGQARAYFERLRVLSDAVLRATRA
jgi:hypothetical protein